MAYDPRIHHRRSIRLQGFDYASEGPYFVTICAQNRACLFGDVRDGEMIPNAAGAAIYREWDLLPHHHPEVILDAFVVMPNHIHGILGLSPGRGEPRVRPALAGERVQGEHKVRPYGTLPGTLGRIVQGYKSRTTHAYIAGVRQLGWPRFDGKLWQASYYEHIVRTNTSLGEIRRYIHDNPQRWMTDEQNPAANGSDSLDAFIRSLDAFVEPGDGSRPRSPHA